MNRHRPYFNQIKQKGQRQASENQKYNSQSTHTRTHQTSYYTVWQGSYSFASVYDGRHIVWNRSKHTTIRILVLFSLYQFERAALWIMSFHSNLWRVYRHIIFPIQKYFLLSYANALVFFLLLLLACVIVFNAIVDTLACAVFHLFTTETREKCIQ